jgi:hypothetical protein
MTHRAVTLLAWLVWAVCVTLSVLTRVLDLITPPVLVTDEPTVADILFSVLTLTYMTVGALVVSHRPGNAIGWLFWASGLFAALAFFAEALAEYTIHVGADQFRAAKYLAWLLTQISLPVLGLAAVLLLLLFPNGRLPSLLLFPESRMPSRSWQVFVWMAVGGSAILALNLVSQPGSSGGPYYVENPLGITGPVHRFLVAMIPIGALLLVVSGLFAGAALISRLALS